MKGYSPAARHRAQGGRDGYGADMPRYADDVLTAAAPRHSKVAQVPAEPDLVVETADGRFCGAIVALGRTVEAGERRDTVTLEDRQGRRRVFPLLPAAFLLDGQPVTLVVPAPSAKPKAARQRTASGSFAVRGEPAKVARASRIWVEGVHDAALVERIWGDDLRVEGVVVEPIDGVDELPTRLREFAPGAGRRVGVLVDHLVPGSKETRIVSTLRYPDVLVTGHPYIDIWQAVKPSALGIERWPAVPKGVNWKDGVCAALAATNPRLREPRELWRLVLASVDSFTDVEVPLLRAVEELIDFVTA